MFKIANPVPTRFLYTNHRGLTALRLVRPISFRWGTSDYYKEPQLLLLAFDFERQAEREFAMAQISDLTADF